MMNNKDFFAQAQKIIQETVTADDYIFRMVSSAIHQTRFAQNGITQHISGTKDFLSIEVAFGNKTGSASGNCLSAEALKGLIERAETTAKMNQPDPEAVPSAPFTKLHQTQNYSPKTAAVTEKDIVDNVLKCVKNAEAKQAKISGFCERTISEQYMITKQGFIGQDSSTSYSHSMTMKRDDVETKVSASVKDYATFDLDALIAQLNGQFDALSSPTSYPTGRIPVILRPAAVLDWLYFLMWMYQRRMADDGMTPYTGQMGNQFFGEKFTLRSTISDPMLSTTRFNGEAVAAQNIDWVKNGVLENMLVSRDYAKVAGLQPNFPCNLVIDGGTATEEEMMKMVDRGIIINRFWYIRTIDQKRGEMTGLTRDGVLYFENGKVQKAVTNFRWNEIFYDMTRRILALGPNQLVEKDVKVPTMLIDGFNLVDSTTF